MLYLLLFLGSCSFSYPYYTEDLEAPRYSINLDDPPEERWEPILNNYNHTEIRVVVKRILEIVIPEWALHILRPLAGVYLTFFAGKTYAGEIRGISKVLSMSTGEVVILNLGYEAAMFCTSIIAEDEKGNVYLGRNMDFLFSNLLAKLTMDVDFKKNGEIAYTGTTFVGYVGLVTGQSPNKFTVAANAREYDTSWWINAISALTKNSSPLSWLIRDTLNEAKSYTDAFLKLSKGPIITQVFFILAGTKAGEGAVITRNRNGVVDARFLDNKRGKWFLVQTNYDHWKMPPTFDDRRTPATAALDFTSQKNISMDSLYQVLSVPPVLNRMTIHTTLMSAAFPENYTTVVRYKVYNKTMIWNIPIMTANGTESGLWQIPRTTENNTQDSYALADTEND
ncbi:uncharacterized protein LOC379721 precursor [Xenopus laevis]|nr:uncharacterized protein LOC379721 precursor [Xenopus laevis]AAH59336.1 MGC69088 protein [Xenopus laevis]